MSEPDRVWEFERGTRLHSFRYPPIRPPAFSPPGAFDPAAGGAEGGGAEGGNREAAHRQEPSAAIAAARAEGLREGQTRAAAEAAQGIERERAAIGAALGEFARERAEYFRRVEADVVKLALSIARKILHREAQLDPLLLAGVVRVALDQMQAGTRLILRTSPETVEAWRGFCAEQLADDQAVEVVPDSSLEAHRCVLEAEVGSTEIGLDQQLQEIESGFFDLLHRRPGGER